MSTLTLKNDAAASIAKNQINLDLYRVIVCYDYGEGITRRFEKFYECVSSNNKAKLSAYFNEELPLKMNPKCTRQWIEEFETVPKDTPYHVSLLIKFEDQKWEELDRLVEISYLMPSSLSTNMEDRHTNSSQPNKASCRSTWTVKGYEVYTKETELLKKGCSEIQKKYVE